GTADRFSKAHVVKLRRLRRQARLDVAQTLPIGQLGERHGLILRGAGQLAHGAIALVASTIRSNVLQGRKSMSCANSVLPVFMANPSPRHRRGEPPAIQIRPSNEVLKPPVCQALTGKLGSTNRTLVHLAESGDSVRGWGESKMQHTAEIGSPPAVAGESGVDSLCESPPCLEREGEPCRQRRPHRFNFRLTMNAN